ncbi:MAG TPA: hypothetical protein VEC37_15145, partial [Bacillota bacterium]|nr:hypothetical protein [Bacillota bacterium]
MKFGYLEWRDERLSIITDSDSTILDIGEVAFEDISYIKFEVEKYYQLAIIRKRQQKCEFWFSKDGLDWCNYPDFPGNNNINLDKDWYFLYPHVNSVGLIRNFGKIFNVCHDNKWESFALPGRIKSIDIKPDLNFLAVGSQPAKRVKNLKEEIACWRKKPNDWEWEEVPITMNSWWNAYKTIQMGGFSELMEVNAQVQPYIFASECSWFLDDQSWFVYLQLLNGKFYAYRLGNLMIDSIRRTPEGLPVVLASNYEENVM